ncbi:uncharacterized protein LOC135080865 [Ostrinia nubilalis]|uniref:uncharacterized protein LOC114352268 n=1 Tax=Ostrinia furnacalis TaxID=93504 RepID=UPI00103B7D83|nr:uncharacterized protein LOC114352268 [Ostrinia furnacalis]
MIYKWWHVFVRRRTKPIPADTALLWKRRLSVAYAVFAWNAFGLVVYSFYQGKADWAHYYGLKTDEEHSTPPGQAWAKTLGIKNAKVYKISGFTKVGEYDIVEGEAAQSDQKNEPETKDEEMLND